MSLMKRATTLAGVGWLFSYIRKSFREKRCYLRTEFVFYGHIPSSWLRLHCSIPEKGKSNKKTIVIVENWIETVALRTDEGLSAAASYHSAIGHYASLGCKAAAGSIRMVAEVTGQ